MMSFASERCGGFSEDFQILEYCRIEVIVAKFGAKSNDDFLSFSKNVTPFVYLSVFSNDLTNFVLLIPTILAMRSFHRLLPMLCKISVRSFEDFT
jgi:hypothetical protein